MRRVLLTVVASIIALAGAVVVMPAIAAPMRISGRQSCHRLARDRIIRSTPRLVVHRGVAPGVSGIHDWVCGRTGARATPVGAEVIKGGTGFPRGERVRRIVAVGSWVVAFESSREGWAGGGCLPAGPVGCPAFHQQMQMIDAGGGSATFSSGPHVSAVHVTSTRRAHGTLIGAAVWIQPLPGFGKVLYSAVTVGRDRSAVISAGPVAEGKIEPASVRLTGLRVHFVENGHRRSARLRAG